MDPEIREAIIDMCKIVADDSCAEDERDMAINTLIEACGPEYIRLSGKAVAFEVEMETLRNVDGPSSRVCARGTEGWDMRHYGAIE